MVRVLVSWPAEVEAEAALVVARAALVVQAWLVRLVLVDMRDPLEAAAV